MAVAWLVGSLFLTFVNLLVNRQIRWQKHFFLLDSCYGPMSSHMLEWSVCWPRSFSMNSDSQTRAGSVWNRQGLNREKLPCPFALPWFFVIDPVLGREEDARSVYADV